MYLLGRRLAVCFLFVGQGGCGREWQLVNLNVQVGFSVGLRGVGKQGETRSAGVAGRGKDQRE